VFLKGFECKPSASLDKSECRAEEHAVLGGQIVEVLKDPRSGVPTGTGDLECWYQGIPGTLSAPAVRELQWELQLS
jgi:hypothetical protein